MEKWIRFASRHKEFIGTTTVVVASVFFLGSFEQSDRVNPVLQSSIVSLGIFLVIPLLYCKIMLGLPLSAIGFQRGNVWAGIGGSILALIVALAGLFVLWNFTPLLDNYLLPIVVQEQFLFFVLYEVFVSGSILFLYEVFFRGFVMLLWLRKWGFWAVVVQAVLFGVLFAASNGINAVTIPYLIFAPFAGLIAYQSRSLWYSYGASWFFLFLTDALVLILR